MAGYDPVFAPGRGARDALYVNDGAGVFADEAERLLPDGGVARSTGAFALDVDRDHDADLLVIRDGGPAALWLNQRVWPFRPGDLPPELTGSAPATGAAAGDVDRDGAEEVLVFRGPGAPATFLDPDGTGRLVAAESPLAALRWRTGAFLDADLDGFLDLVGDDVLVLDGTGKPIGPPAGGAGLAPPDARGIAFADFDGDGDVDRAVATPGGAFVLATAAPPGNRWIALDLEGRKSAYPVQSAPTSGPDAEVEVRAGDLWQMHRARATSGYLGAVEPFVRIGIGARSTVDYLRIRWPDRCVQTMGGIDTRRTLKVVETEGRYGGW